MRILKRGMELESGGRADISYDPPGLRTESPEPATPAFLTAQRRPENRNARARPARLRNDSQPQTIDGRLMDGGD